jgi:hypothetical protein
LFYGGSGVRSGDGVLWNTDFASNTFAKFSDDRLLADFLYGSDDGFYDLGFSF